MMVRNFKEHQLPQKLHIVYAMLEFEDEKLSNEHLRINKIRYTLYHLNIILFFVNCSFGIYGIILSRFTLIFLHFSAAIFVYWFGIRPVIKELRCKKDGVEFNVIMTKSKGEV